MARFSNFGNKLGGESGITGLMEDLGNALNSGSDMIMMGGGNPAHIPVVEELFRDRLAELANSPDAFRRLIGIYDPPQGEIDFIGAIADLLRREYQWPVSRKNIALTNGSQAAFFMLFNMFGGRFNKDDNKQILLPLAPEYIGYSDAGLNDHLFRAFKPNIERIDQQTFKYKVDFDSLEIDKGVGAICVSRPTNPTGNVLTDKEVARLDQLAKQNDVPFIIDGAYGTPFPNLIFEEVTPHWNDNTVVCLSLSKLGLPAVRTGIVVAREDIIENLSGMNAVMNLSTGSFGPMLAHELVKSGEILSMSQNHVKPYYAEKAVWAEDYFKTLCRDLPVSLHKVEGAMFLWVWMEDCPVDSQTLYERLKQRGVLVVSGHHFFPGLSDKDENEWRHSRECLRVTYSQDKAKVKRGLEVLADTLREAYEN
ncbi:MAG: valine--pyruvate transaminase [Oleiphilaceae bacterium]|nr:valine--pyruvate transaminase [Oleiphilaceae bacterium]